MPIYWGEYQTPSCAGLPFTEVRIGDRTLHFKGRPGAKLQEAVDHLRAMAGKIVRPAPKVRKPQGPKRKPKKSAR